MHDEPSHLRRRKYSVKKWFERFESFGFVYRAINDLSGALEERTIEQLKDVESVNLLFARPAAQVWSTAGVTSS